MCGIFGWIADRPASQRLVRAIHDVQRHRGPDGAADWSARFGSGYLTLAFQRLAIIDLSPEAMQPFVNPQTGSALIFNGEIYNYVELRALLEQEGQVFKTRSDTEVLLRALDVWGLEKALEKLNGMFAFAWFDAATGTLVLARDRAGEKPLYYHRRGRSLVFGSELKTILAGLDGHRLKPNAEVIYRLLAQSVGDDSEQTMLEGVIQVRPGEACRISEGAGELVVRSAFYWDPGSLVGSSTQTLKDLVDECRALLIDSVRIRMRSDVPIGFLLSGGLDSTALIGAALAAGLQPSAVAAFSSTGGESEADESSWIELACRYFGISSTVDRLSPSAEEFRELFHGAVNAHDGPFTSFSVVAQYALMRSASKMGRIVLLSGQGADELFCGYAKYSAFYVQQLMRDRRPIAASRAMLDIARVGTLLPQVSMEELQRYLPKVLHKDSRRIYGPRLQGFSLVDIGLAGGSLGQRQVEDLQRFSVPMINHYEDRVSMAWSRELRMPYLDPRVIKFALGLPDEFKIGHGWTKYILRKATEGLVPAEIAWRRDKKGYAMPTLRWLRQEMVPVMKEVLHPDALVFRHGYLDHDAFWTHYNKLIRSGSTSSISTKEIVGIVTLEKWLSSVESSLDFGGRERLPHTASSSVAGSSGLGVQNSIREPKPACATKAVRVAQVTSAHVPNDNRITYHIASTLADSGYQTTVVAPWGTAAPPPMPQGVKLIALKERADRLGRFISRHGEILRKVRGKFDIVHIHDPDLLILGMLLTTAGQKVIYDAHECYRDDVEEKTWMAWPVRRLARHGIIAAEAVAARAFAGVISASAEIDDAIKPRRGTIIRNFPRRSPELEPAAQNGFGDREYLAGYFGSIDELRYGLEMIEAFAILRRDHPNAKLIVAGRISLPLPSAEIRARLEQLDIEYHNYLSRPQMAALMARCKVGLALYRHTLPYERIEFSTKVLEYVSMGATVVTGPHPQVVKRFVEDNDIGINIGDSKPATIANAISALTSDPEKWERHSRKAREVGLKYSWDSESQKLLGLYSQVAEAQ